MPSADFCAAVGPPYDGPSPVAETQRRSPEVRPTAFTARPSDLPPRSLMTMDFAIISSLVRPGRPRYPLLVHRAAALLHASFRPHLAVTPLRFANPSPPSGWIEDFHLRAVDHARHTEKGPPGRAALSVLHERGYQQRASAEPPRTGCSGATECESRPRPVVRKHHEFARRGRFRPKSSGNVESSRRAARQNPSAPTPESPPRDRGRISRGRRSVPASGIILRRSARREIRLPRMTGREPEHEFGRAHLRAAAGIPYWRPDVRALAGAKKWPPRASGRP